MLSAFLKYFQSLSLPGQNSTQINKPNNYLIPRNRALIRAIARYFSIVHSVRNGSRVLPASSYSMGTEYIDAVVKLLVNEVDHSPSSSNEAKNAWSYRTTLPYVAMSCRGAILRSSQVTEGEHSTSNVQHRNSRHDPGPVSFTFLSPHMFSKNATGCFMAHKLSMKFEGEVKGVRKKIRVKTRKNKEQDARYASQNRRIETKCGTGIRMNITRRKMRPNKNIKTGNKMNSTKVFIQ